MGRGLFLLSVFGIATGHDVGSLFSCPLTGCPDGGPPQQLIGGIKYAGDVAQYGYVTDFNASTVWVWDKQNQSRSQTTFTSPAGIDTDGAGHVFMVESSGPIQVQSDLTNKITLGPTFSGASDIATTGNGYVYWTGFGMNATRVIRWGKTGQANSQADLVDLGTMMNHQNVAANGSALVYQQSAINSSVWDIVVCPSGPPCNSPSKIASGQTLGIRQGNMILDSSDVYWTTNDSMMHGNVVRCATNGCNNTPALVGQVPVGNNPQPAGVAVDSTFVYFLMGDNAGTKLYRVVKQ